MNKTALMHKKPLNNNNIIATILLLAKRRLQMRTLSITIDEKLYDRLKQAVPTRGISAFVGEAVTAHLSQKEDTLYQAYQEACNDHARTIEMKEWDALEGDL